MTPNQSTGLWTLLAFLTTLNKLGIKYHNPNGLNPYDCSNIPASIAREFVKKWCA